MRSDSLLTYHKLFNANTLSQLTHNKSCMQNHNECYELVTVHTTGDMIIHIEFWTSCSNSFLVKDFSWISSSCCSKTKSLSVPSRLIISTLEKRWFHHFSRLMARYASVMYQTISSSDWPLLEVSPFKFRILSFIVVS